jgi:Tol biopolymer transport system component
LLEAQQYSPDGTSRVYAEAEGEDSVTNLYVFRDDLPSSWLRRWVLVDHGVYAYDPAWSPDGQRIVFVSQATGNDEIWVVNADGSGEAQLTFNDWEWDKGPSWSPDSSEIVFWSNRVTGTKQVWVMNADGSDQHNISKNEYNDWQPVWIGPNLLALVQEQIAAAQAERVAAQSAAAAPTLVEAGSTDAPAMDVPATATPVATPASSSGDSAAGA